MAHIIAALVMTVSMHAGPAANGSLVVRTVAGMTAVCTVDVIAGQAYANSCDGA